MLEKGFMSEIQNYERISLGSVERHFLARFCWRPTSAYGLWRILETNRAKHKMAYKNVHKRVKRLYELGLLQEVKGDFQRNAKPYRLTSRGLFEMLLVPYRPGFPNPDICNNYRDDLVVKNILYQYFEPESIVNFGLQALSWLGVYMTKCCEAILRNVEYFREAIKMVREGKNSEFEYDSELLAADIDQSIRDEIRNLIFQIVTLSGYDKMGRKSHHGTIFPVLTLVRDRKFMKVLGEMKDDFSEGCKNFY